MKKKSSLFLIRYRIIEIKVILYCKVQKMIVLSCMHGMKRNLKHGKVPRNIGKGFAKSRQFQIMYRKKVRGTV